MIRLLSSFQTIPMINRFQPKAYFGSELSYQRLKKSQISAKCHLKGKIWLVELGNTWGSCVRNHKFDFRPKFISPPNDTH